MSKYVNLGDCVEGAKCSIYTRKYDHKGLREDPILQKPMSVYELSRNCSVEVTQVLPLAGEELEIRRQNNVHLEVGDKLKADSITLYVDELRKMKFTVSEGLTSRHGGQLCDTRKRTFGKIKYPIENLKKFFETTTIVKEIPEQL